VIILISLHSFVENNGEKKEMHKSNLYCNMLTVSIVLREEKVVTWQRIQRKLKNNKSI